MTSSATSTIPRPSVSVLPGSSTLVASRQDARVRVFVASRVVARAAAGGHIGFGVRPTARRRGLSTWALGAVPPEARSLGLTRVLVTCDDHNLGSARTIENNGGALEDIHDTDLGRTRRY